MAGLGWTDLAWGHSVRMVRGDIALLLVGAVALLCARVVKPNSNGWRINAEDELEVDRVALRFLDALSQPTLAVRRDFYRADTAEIVDQYQRDSRKYRRVHNSLQSLIMIGSATTTIIGALDSGSDLTWQSATIVGVSFAITLAAMFTGYYKYRERAYFLQQTADSIEEESNAFRLGVGPYKEFDPGQADQALAKFASRVEDLRNEQRRRQQQLDQPADQADAAAPAPA
ncbi:DUF4231 domain-containing protein [Streptacidiphilus albus]|uniref:DUF4231 domain-containing protein n=1 Tax=Streptacidiphilus albus TaxID=105425 RepID=UPI001E583057|nr:DUF4231 domain-containing protein [Streptacidiphilus albus]